MAKGQHVGPVCRARTRVPVPREMQRQSLSLRLHSAGHSDAADKAEENQGGMNKQATAELCVEPGI
ncbi:hypothetical protein A6R68_16339 [Neotoma lepida]|uniref:Uncharacterized protein n=1 Tax=Neotoma lepida TaxID=56216 RepID=A0A1A6HHW2_NEOLE|nr:hypothetical protein A6R68_16339 [Neotoma lepida]